ncbi:hypothetical protein HS125_15695 [bacterium]|nr:hypothetical protein [bacterium]
MTASTHTDYSCLIYGNEAPRGAHPTPAGARALHHRGQPRGTEGRYLGRVGRWVATILWNNVAGVAGNGMPTRIPRKTLCIRLWGFAA